ncbi:MAG: hypothetical protein ACOCXY_03255 [Planctomycetota bacterium]
MLDGKCRYPSSMGFPVGNPYLETAAYVLLTLVLAAATYFWGRGIRKSHTGDLIAGPSILCGLCLSLSLISDSSAVFSLIGELVGVFEIATIFLSFMASGTTKLKRRDVLAVGVGTIIVGISLMLVL